MISDLRFKNILSKILKPRVKYRSLIEVRVFKDALLHNLRQYQQGYPKLQFAPVLKSNAYGHGLWQVAQVLDKQSLPFFMVDSFYEALTLRQRGVKTKILILGFIRPEELRKDKIKNVSVGIISLEQLRFLSAKLATPKKIHLKIDTGMHRQGILLEETSEAMKLIKNNSNIVLEGVCSHFADADSALSAFTEEQITRWNAAAEKFRQNFPEIKYYHLANTAGVRYAERTVANVGRLGLGLYGINPQPLAAVDLRPALEMKSVISAIKQVSAGAKIGYGITFEAVKSMRIATVPVGYNEGVDRRLSNRGYYKCRGRFCPLVGRVSMNISAIDVSDVPDVKMEDEVIIISRERTDRNSVENMARLCDCMPYEILVRIPQHLRRVVV